MGDQGRASRLLDGSPVLLGVVAIGIGVTLLLLDLTGKLASTLSAKDSRAVTAVFKGTQQLRTGDEVRIDGVKVGRVAGFQRADDGRQVKVRMDVEKSAGPLYRDARASVRFKIVLGGAFYVRLQRGTPATGALRGSIPPSRTSGQTEVEDLTSVFAPDAVRGLQTLPGELAQALRDAQAPARALSTLATASPSLTHGLRALRGQQIDSDLRRLVASSAKTVKAIDTPDDQVRDVVAGAAATLQVTAARQQDLRTTISRAPAVLRRTDATVLALDHTLTLADPLVADLQRSAPLVAPTLRELHPTVVRADTLLRRAVPLLRALRPAVTSLAGAAQVAQPLLRELTPSLVRANETILPYLNEKDPETQHTTSEMIGPTFTGLGSGAAGQQDNNGHFIRFPATSGNSPVYLPCQVYFGNPSAPEAIQCKSVQDALSAYLNYPPLGGTPGSAP